VTRPIDIIRRINARQLAAERRSPSWPMNTIRRGLMITRSEPDMKIIHRSAEAESAESDRRNLGKPPPGADRRAGPSHDVAADAIARIQIKARMVAKMRALGMKVLDDEIF
jgi:hypothetical protein